MKVHFVTTSREYVDEKAGVWRVMDAVPNVGDQVEFSVPEQKKLERETPFLVVNARAFLADNCVVCEVDVMGKEIIEAAKKSSNEKMGALEMLKFELDSFDKNIIKNFLQMSFMDGVKFVKAENEHE